MEYKIMKKDSFTVVGLSRYFSTDSSMKKIPEFWNEVSRPCGQKTICGYYGVCIDGSSETPGSNPNGTFEYLIADNYDPSKEIPEGCVTRVIPAFTWAVFPCRGAMPDALQTTNKAIFSEWLPNCREYEIAAGINIEMYSDPRDFLKGLQDEKYYSEIWIPVKKKE